MALHPVVLCGGSGTRLWPASRPDKPKQFLPLTGANSSFQETLLRLKGLEAERPIVVTGPAMAEEARAQASAVGVDVVLLIEPQPRNSGPAAAAAAAYVKSLDPEGVVLLLAADHYVGEPEKFCKAAAFAAKAAADGRIVTFGVRPNHPATGYGYIQPGERLSEGVFAVQAFVEKPDAGTARRYLAEGRLWNSGNFCFRADLLLSEIAAFEPAMAEAADAAVRNGGREGPIVRLADDDFARAPAKSIDYAVMEHTRRAAVVMADFTWSDLGSWPSIREAAPLDAHGNAVSGAARLVDVKDSLVRSDGPLVVAIGVEGLAIVVDGDGVLVAPLARADEVKEIAAGS